MSIAASCTTKNPVISANFLVWKFCEKAQFPFSLGQIVIKPKEIVIKPKESIYVVEK